jgi:hypothetical protein
MKQNIVKVLTVLSFMIELSLLCHFFEDRYCLDSVLIYLQKSTISFRTLTSLLEKADIVRVDSKEKT